ncbi:ran-binding protein 3-like isoform X2 [Osmerus eperlanus]|uniref:ran-binding protein 3-like isoform X2 n=1 Tax=Osmerus eperlanus TaxID=29151 RepID=UPI002E0FCB65
MWDQRSHQPAIRGLDTSHVQMKVRRLIVRYGVNVRAKGEKKQRKRGIGEEERGGLGCPDWREGTEVVAVRMEDDQEKPALTPPVFVFQKDKAQKRPAEGCSAEDGGDSTRDDRSYCPPVKRERTLSLNQNSSSHSEEKTGGFRLKPPTLIHGQAPSAGVPSQKPKEEHHRSVLRPAVLQAPTSTTLPHTGVNSGTNGVNCSSETPAVSHGDTDDHACSTDDTHVSRECKSRSESQRGRGGRVERKERKEPPAEFVFGQNVKDRAKVDDCSESSDSKDSGVSADPPPGETNYFLQYISTPSSQTAAPDSDSSAKFVFGQNMSDRVLSPPAEGSTEPLGPAPGQPRPPERSIEKEPSAAVESLEASAAAYTKATARHCLLEKVEVITGEEAESNVLQIQCKLFVFDKLSQSWVERGRGLLRLNDMASTDDGSLQSRLVMRTQGSLRLILNTKLWAQMQTEKAGEKSLRITAMDTEDQGLKVFLIAASSKDTGQLYAALHHRILALRNRSEQDPEPRPPLPPGHAPQSNEDDSDEDRALNHAPAATTTGAAPNATETGPGLSEGAVPQTSGSS